MLIDEIKKANINAMKQRNLPIKNIYSLIISKYQLLKTSNPELEITDDDILKIINKTIKELQDEYNMYHSNNRLEKAEEIKSQMAALQIYLPKMLTEDEIRNIISNLPDKSVKSIMTHFKENYKSKVDMSLVNKISKENL